MFFCFFFLFLRKVISVYSSLQSYAVFQNQKSEAPGVYSSQWVQWELLIFFFIVNP